MEGRGENNNIVIFKMCVSLAEYAHFAGQCEDGRVESG